MEIVIVLLLFVVTVTVAIKTITTAPSYDKRWKRNKYVKMVHKTRELEKENLGKIITECRCHDCAAQAEIEKKKAHPPKGPGGGSRPKSSIELQKPAYYPARNCRRCWRCYQSGDISLCGSCRRSEQFRSTSLLPDDVPAHAHAQLTYDPMLLSDVVYWTWIDRDTGHKIGVRQIVPAQDDNCSWAAVVRARGVEFCTGPHYHGEHWTPCHCSECDPVIRTPPRKSLRQTLTRRLA